MSNRTDKIVRLRDIEHKTWGQISAAIGCESEAARSRYRKAKRREQRSKKASDQWRKAGENERPPSGNEDEVRKTANTNTLELESASKRIKTLEELLKACEVDLDVWKVEHYIVNKWEVGRKHTKSTLTFDGGRITGDMQDSGEIFVEPLFQVKAWLIRKLLVPVYPVVQPIALTLGGVKMWPAGKAARPSSDVGLYQALILPDIQAGFRKDINTGALDPFHDRSALDVALQVARDVGFDAIVFLGDLLDLSEWSDRFLKSPEFYWTSQPAIVEVAWWLAQFRLAAPKAKIAVIEGNHDARLEDSMVTHLAAAYQLRAADEIKLPPALSVQKLLALDSLGIEWAGGYPDSVVWLNDGLRCVHGDIANSALGATAGAMVNKSPVSTVFGHIHRIEQATKTITDRQVTRTVTALSPGCLCRVDGTAPSHKLSDNWQHGLAVAYYDGGTFCSVEAIPIHSGKTIVGGKVYQARERVGDLARETGWKF